MPPRKKKVPVVSASVLAIPRVLSLGSRAVNRAPLPAFNSGVGAFISSLGEAPKITLQVDDRDIPDMVSVNIDSLLEKWEGADGYRVRLEYNINLLRDDKLKLYAGATMTAKRDVELSQARVEVWRRVFEERYGLSGDPATSSESFLSHGVEKLIPDDIDNINRYMRFRALFLMLYKEAVERGSPLIDTPECDCLTNPKCDERCNIIALAPPEPEAKKGGRSKRVGGARQRKKVYDDTKCKAEVAKWKTLAYVRPDSCADPKSGVSTLACVRADNKYLQEEVNKELNLRELAEDALEELQDRRRALKGDQEWMTADWPNLEVLSDSKTAVQDLKDTLIRSQSEMVGRDEIMNRLASIVHTFAYNHRAFTQTYLNYALLGMPGTGKTTIAQTIGDILRNLGILVTKKFTQIGREDMVGQYLGETALKTKALLINHIEGMLFLDEAYSLGTRDSSGKPDVYGAEALNTLTNFTDKWRGQFSFLAAGYEDNMNQDFFAVNRGLERRFLRLTLDKFSPKQLLAIFFQKLLRKIQNEADRRILGDPNVWRYTLGAFEVMNEKCEGTKRNIACLFPNQGGDMETLSDETVQYYYNFVRTRPNADFTVCDMRNILQRFLFRTQRAHIVIDTASPIDTVKLCALNQGDTKTAIRGRDIRCNGMACLRLTDPNTKLISALRSGSILPDTFELPPRLPTSASTSSRPSRRGGAFFHPTRLFKPLFKPIRWPLRRIIYY